MPERKTKEECRIHRREETIEEREGNEENMKEEQEKEREEQTDTHIHRGTNVASRKLIFTQTQLDTRGRIVKGGGVINQISIKIGGGARGPIKKGKGAP